MPRRRLRPVLVLAVASAFTTLPALAQERCSTAWTWGAPQMMRSAGGRPAYVESPHALATRDGLLLLGQPAIVWQSEQEFAPPLPVTPRDTARFVEAIGRDYAHFGFVLTAGGTAVPVPAPRLSGSAKYVLGTITRDARVHAVWRQEEAADSSGHAGASLWHASRRGGRWTRPRKIFTSEMVHWWAGNGALLTDGDALYLVASYAQTGSGGGLVIARMRDEKWRVTPASMPAFPGLTTAALVGNDSLLVVYEASDVHAGVANGSHLFATLSSRGGTSMSNPVRIQWSGLDNVSWTRLAVMQGDRGERQLSLAWAKRARDGATPDSLFVMESHDSGQRWEPEPGITLPGQMSSIDAVSHAGGAWHFVMRAQRRSGSEPSGGLTYLARRARQWMPLVDLDIGEVATEPTLSALGDDEMFLSWGRAVTSSVRYPDREQAPIGMYSVLRRCVSR